MKKQIKKLLSVFFTIILIMISADAIHAADFNVTCSSSGDLCSNSGGKLFNETNFAPGSSVTKTVQVDNYNNHEGCDFYVVANNIYQSADPGDFIDKLFLSIRDKDSDIDLVGVQDGYGNATNLTSLSYIYNNWVNLGYINSGTIKLYEWVITFNSDANNEYQGNELSFNLDLNFTCGSPPSDNAFTDTSSAILGVTTTSGKNFLETIFVDNEENKELIPEVKGYACDDENYYWWLPLVIQFIVLLITFYIITKNRSKYMRFRILTIIFAVISQIIHQLLSCNCATGNLCTRYIFINLLITVTFLLLTFIAPKISRNY